MKILVLSDDFLPEVAGGAGMIAFRLTKEFARQGHEVLVVSATGDSTNIGRSETEGVPVHRVYSKYHERWRQYRSLWNPTVLPEIEKILRQYKPDVVHAHNVHMHLSYAALSLAHRHGAKVFMTAHDIMSFYPGTFTEFIDPKDLSCPESFNYRVSFHTLFEKFRLRYNPFRNIFIRNVLRRIQGVIAVSESLKDALAQNSIPVREVIYNGIDIAAWNVSLEEERSFRSSLGLGDAPIVLFGGRLSGAKGGSLILEAMQRISGSVPDAKLLVVGRKDFYAERMLQRAAELGIGDKVVFAGWLSEDDMKRAYAAASVVAIPSVCFDSFPNGNLEAFASGKPIVATCFGGSREIVRDGENGFIVNPFNIPALSAAITMLLSDKERAHSFGEAGKKLVREHYSIEEVAKKYLSLFAR